uniref:Transglycosylase SLT domain-containing protein n=1 Tax=viral metagenome TaxID=1070528 RepID=A0A6M3JN77_9ZZZZ
MNFLIPLLIASVVSAIAILPIPGREFTYSSGNEEDSTKGQAQAHNPTGVAPSVEILADKIIQCESGGDNNAVGDNGKARGIAQFHRPTFDWLCRLSGKDLNYYNAQDQRELLVWALENGRGYLWSCFRNL